MILIYAFFYLISRILGLIRNQLMLAYFGISANTMILDAYFGAFKVPDFIFNVIFIGAITTIFIPLFTKYKKESEEKAQKFTIDMLRYVSFIFIIICATSWFFMDYIMMIITPGFDGEKLNLTIALSKIMIISPLLFAISSIFGSICNIHRKIIYISIAPVMYNLGIIFSIIFLSPIYGIHGVAWGVVFGAFLHMLFQFSGASNYIIKSIKNFSFFKYKLDFFTNEIRYATKIAIPRIISLISMQIMITFEAIFASFLAPGSVAHFNIADNLGNLPVGMVGLTLSVIGFPILAQLAVEKDYTHLKNFIHKNFNIIGFFIIPITFLTILYSKDIIGILFLYGKFTLEDLNIIYTILVFFALSFLPQTLIPIISKVFYSMEDTKTPMYIAIFIMFLNLILLILFINILNIGIIALPLVYGICVYIQCFTLLYFLHLKNIFNTSFFNNFLNYTIVSMILSIITYLPIYFNIIKLNAINNIILVFIFCAIYTIIYRKNIFNKFEI